MSLAPEGCVRRARGNRQGDRSFGRAARRSDNPMTKTWISAAILIASATVSSAALACPVGTTDFRPVRPVENVSFQVSELFERATRLEGVASSHDARARTLEQEADRLASRARILRSQAASVDAADRPGVVALADELTSRSLASRGQAGRERAQAADLRLEAKGLRQRAVALSRGNGTGDGWRGRPIAWNADLR